MIAMPADVSTVSGISAAKLCDDPRSAHRRSRSPLSCEPARRRRGDETRQRLTGVLLALAASLSWGIADFGAGVASRRLSIPLVIAATQTAGLVFIACVVAIFHPSLPSGAQFAWGALAGAVGIFGLAAFYRGLAVGAMGIVGPLSATAAILVSATMPF